MRFVPHIDDDNIAFWLPNAASDQRFRHTSCIGTVPLAVIDFGSPRTGGAPWAQAQDLAWLSSKVAHAPHLFCRDDRMPASVHIHAIAFREHGVVHARRAQRA